MVSLPTILYYLRAPADSTTTTYAKRYMAFGSGHDPLAISGIYIIIYICYGFWKSAEDRSEQKAPSFQCENTPMILNFSLL